MNNYKLFVLIDLNCQIRECEFVRKFFLEPTLSLLQFVSLRQINFPLASLTLGKRKDKAPRTKTEPGLELRIINFGIISFRAAFPPFFSIETAPLIHAANACGWAPTLSTPLRGEGCCRGNNAVKFQGTGLIHRNSAFPSARKDSISSFRLRVRTYTRSFPRWRTTGWDVYRDRINPPRGEVLGSLCSLSLTPRRSLHHCYRLVIFIVALREKFRPSA